MGENFLEGVVATTFILAALTKLAFRTSVGPLLAAGLGDRVTRRVAPLVPAVELLIGLTVLGGAFFGVAAACGASFAFVWLQLRNQRRHAPVACNCFGPVDSRLPGFVLVSRAAFLAVLAGVLMLMSLGASLQLAPDLPSDLDALASGVAVGLAATLGISLVGATWQFRRERLLPLTSGDES